MWHVLHISYAQLDHMPNYFEKHCSRRFPWEEKSIGLGVGGLAALLSFLPLGTIESESAV